MKFYQLTVLPWQQSSPSATISHVFNYVTLTEALNCPFYAGDEKNGVADGEPYRDNLTGETLYQYHFVYNDKTVNNKYEVEYHAVVELRHERIIKVEGGQTTETRKCIIREITL